MLQAAIDQTAGARVPLVLGPGEYRTGELKLPSGAQIVGVRGATRLVFTGGSAVVSAARTSPRYAAIGNRVGPRGNTSLRCDGCENGLAPPDLETC